MLLKDANSFNMDFLHKPNKNPNSIGARRGAFFPEKPVEQIRSRGGMKPRAGRDGLDRVLRAADRVGVVLIGTAIVAYCVFGDQNQNKPLSKEKQRRREEALSNKQTRSE